MASTIKVNNIQNQCGANIANKCGTTITLGASGDTITLACGASQTGFGRTGTVDWDTTAKTASFTAVSGNGYFVNTTSGVITVTLPAGSAGDIVSLADYAATWQTNAVTVTPNGTDKIGGTNANVTLTTEGQSVTFVYTDSTQGWLNTMDSTSNVRGNSNLIATGGTITTCGDYKIHTFTGPGTFTVSQVSQTAADNTVSYLVVGGGAGGGTVYAGGGGGAGGFREYRAPVSGCYAVSPLNGAPAITVTATSYPITVGAGGAAGCNGTPNEPTSRGNPGSVSTFSTTTSAGGGGGGGGGNAVRPLNLGAPGGSGGGGMGNCASSPNVSGGTGNTPPTTPAQGNNGGPGSTSGPTYGSGGGGGAGAVGGSGTSSSYGSGGAGVSTSITGSATSYAGGGGGGKISPGYPGPGGDASPCGTGGIGANNPTNAGGNGTTNTGGGGGGGSYNPEKAGGTGGSGIVIIRYKYR